MDAILSAIEQNDLASLNSLLVFRPVACRTAIRDAGDLPQCPTGVTDGSLVNVFPENYCEGSYLYEGQTPDAFANDEPSQLYGVYRGSRFGTPGDYAVVVWPGGLWSVDDGRIVEINHACGAFPRDFVARWQLTETIFAPPP